MRRNRALLGGLLVCMAAGLIACSRPEAERTRGGGPGADIGNRGTVVTIHEGAVPYYRTPCVTTLDACTGPLPTSGRPTSTHSSTL
jgi:hypothetical protein